MPRARVPVEYLPDTVELPPPLPDQGGIADFSEYGLKFSREELELIRTAMHHHAIGRKPRMLWNGWKIIAQALLLGEREARRRSGASEGRGFNAAIGPFLKLTGFAFLNAGVRYSLKQCAKHIDEIEAWRDSLPDHVRAGLNDPMSVWQHFEKREPRGSGKGKTKRPGYRPEQPSLLEAYVALEDRCNFLEDELDETRALMNHIERKFPEIAPELERHRLERLQRSENTAENDPGRKGDENTD